MKTAKEKKDKTDSILRKINGERGVSFLNFAPNSPTFETLSEMLAIF
jgi:hypothetical protein